MRNTNTSPSSTLRGALSALVLWVLGVTLIPAALGGEQTNVTGGAVGQAGKPTSGPGPQVVTLTGKEVEQVKQRLHLLQRDMSKQQALSILGLSQYVGRLHELSAGSGQTGSSVYTLREGHTLTLHYLYTGPGTNRVMEASLDGEAWRGRAAH